MTRLSPRHPRYQSLVTRATLADAARRGVVVPEGLIAHGRAEAFDYFLGERTSPSARRAERVAAAWLVRAQRPVVSVNGNVAALASREVAALARAIPGLGVEINLFHRTPARARSIARQLRRAGISDVLGEVPSARLPGLDSDRAAIDARGIALADVVLVPLEDGDRALALRRAGKRVIAIDLNPLSRTARVADLPIIDELRRALRGIRAAIRSRTPERRPRGFPQFDAKGALADAVRTMGGRLTAVTRPIGRARGRSGRRRPRGTGRPRRRTP
ncbi:MAG TPA: phosphopantothenate/pantothenate synthetase [Thermoplasmata archaeon]|nr:phosphopantothenate/pantothenate synthetase [Thermoplasmata archaeon]